MMVLLIGLILTLASRKSYPLIWSGLLPVVVLGMLCPVPHTSTYLCDTLSMWLIILALYVLLMMHQPPTPHSQSLWLLLVALTTILCLLFSVDSVLVFYLLFEATLIPMGLVILGWGAQPERVAASVYMLFYTITATLPFLGLVLQNSGVYFSAGGLFFADPFITLIIFIPFLVKAPMYLMHLWLPKAHVEAPVYGSMVLAAVLLKMSIYGLIRLTQLGLCSPWVVSLSMVGGAMACVITLIQSDVKSLIAYSSVVHMAIVSSYVALNPCSYFSPALMMLLGHGVCSSGLFLIATLTYSKYNTRSLLLIQGLLTVSPSLVLLWGMLLMMNMSTPPSITLASEVFMSAACISFSILSSLPIGVIVFASAAYTLQLFSVVSHGPVMLYNSNCTPASYYASVFMHSLFWVLSPLLFWVME